MHSLTKIENPGYDAYPLLEDPQDRKWDIAILDVKEASRHFHKKSTEHFVVLNGSLDIEIGGIHHHLQPGQSVHIPPNTIHHLKSASSNPVRLLCTSFPAFDPADFYLDK